MVQETMRRQIDLATSLGLTLLLVSACNSGGPEADGSADDGSGSISDSLGTDSSTTTPGDGDGDADGTVSDTTADDASDVDTNDDGPPGECQVGTCQGKVYECGDCIDNDGDGLIDAADPNCWGPCDNNEAGWKGEIPGQQNNSTCNKMDCYFDQDGGSGNDDCYWSQTCDPLEPMSCTYDDTYNVPGTGFSCDELHAAQSDLCHEYCGPLVPNGCDCFGCCQIHVGNDVHTVYIGTEDGGGNGTCGLENAADPEKCQPCTQVEGCFAPCDPDDCQICLGQTEVPEGCDEAKCPDGIESCDPQNGNADCLLGQSCITGCCYAPPG
jgi:hypothetical protein